MSIFRVSDRRFGPPELDVEMVLPAPEDLDSVLEDLLGGAQHGSPGEEVVEQDERDHA
jgi:hypothetical protein